MESVISNIAMEIAMMLKQRTNVDLDEETIEELENILEKVLEDRQINEPFVRRVKRRTITLSNPLLHPQF